MNIIELVEEYPLITVMSDSSDIVQSVHRLFMGDGASYALMAHILTESLSDSVVLFCLRVKQGNYERVAEELQSMNWMGNMSNVIIHPIRRKSEILTAITPQNALLFIDCDFASDPDILRSARNEFEFPRSSHYYRLADLGRNDDYS